MVVITAHRDVAVGDGKPPLQLEFKIHSDFESGSLYMSVFVPSIFTAYEDCCRLPSMYEEIMNETVDYRQSPIQRPGETSPESLKDFTFTRKVYIYHDGGLSEEHIGEIARLHRAAGLTARFRGARYLEYRRAIMTKKS